MPSISITNIVNGETVSFPFDITGAFSNTGSSSVVTEETKSSEPEQLSAQQLALGGIQVTLKFNKSSNGTTVNTLSALTKAGGGFTLTVNSGALPANADYDITPSTASVTGVPVTGVHVS